ncbi:hypothetical protein HN51_032724 [Arachis hypogaea]
MSQSHRLTNLKPHSLSPSHAELPTSSAASSSTSLPPPLRCRCHLLFASVLVIFENLSTMSASYPEDVQSSEPGFISATLSIFESVRSLGQSESMSSPQPQSQPQTQTQTQQPSLSLRNDQNNEGTRSKRRRDKANNYYSRLAEYVGLLDI